MTEYGISMALADGKDRSPALEGRFVVPTDTDIAYAEHALRALVLVVSASFGYSATRPFQSRMPLDDEVEVEGGAVRGEFTIALDEFIDTEQDDSSTYYLLMSIGPFLSNILVVEL